MTFVDLLQWWNLVFDLPFVAALIPLLLQATGLFHFGHGHGLHIDHHADIGGHHVGHLGHGAHADTHVSVAHHGMTHAPPAHAHTSTGAHHDTHTETHSPGLAARILGLLGVGKVPFMMVFSSFCFVWGFVGIAANLGFSSVLPLPEIYIWPSLATALVCSFALTRIISEVLSRLIPSEESYGTAREDLLGCAGKAAYEITEGRGAAWVLDRYQNRIQVKCKTTDGIPIPSGAQVRLLEYDEKSETFLVCPQTEDSANSRMLN